jgi:hypothetical protein
MENNSPRGMKVPLIVIGVAVLGIAAGIFVRSRKSSSSPVTLEPAPASVPEPAPALTPEPAPVPAQSPEPRPPIRYSSLAATDKNGDNWTLGLMGVPPRLPEGCTRAGAPLLVKADVSSGSGQSISIGLTIQGQAGEVYEPGMARSGIRMPAPKFKILNESGTVLGSGSFEYG